MFESVSKSTVDPSPPEKPSSRFPEAFNPRRLDVSGDSLMCGSSARRIFVVTKGKKQSLFGLESMFMIELDRINWYVLAVYCMTYY